jgi:transcriptional regulator with XRE-family HTH domain
MPISKRIYLARKARGLSQKELAEKVGFTSRMLVRYEIDFTGPLKTLVRIAQALNVSIYHLIQDSTLKVMKDDLKPFMRKYFKKLLELPPKERKRILDMIEIADYEYKRIRRSHPTA